MFDLKCYKLEIPVDYTERDDILRMYLEKEMWDSFKLVGEDDYASYKSCKVYMIIGTWWDIWKLRRFMIGYNVHYNMYPVTI